jgi:hypothetical protein
MGHEGILCLRDGRIRVVSKIKAAAGCQQVFPGFDFQGTPKRVCLAHQICVCSVGICVAYDARSAMRTSPVVADLELLKGDHFMPGTNEPPRCCTPRPTHAYDRDFHGRLFAESLQESLQKLKMRQVCGIISQE